MRSRTRGWTPGVCGAVARHLGVSRRSVRWTFVLLTLAGGAGLAAYVFLWALTPEGDVDTDPSQVPGHETPPERRQWGVVLGVGGVLVVVGAVLLTPVLGGGRHRHGPGAAVHDRGRRHRRLVQPRRHPALAVARLR